MDKKIDLILGILKTIYINLKYLNFMDAIKLPIIVSRNVRLKSLSGTIKINSNIQTGMIKLGFGNVGIFDKKLDKSILELEGRLVFEGKCNLGHGFKFAIMKNGELTIGNKFVLTAHSSIICDKKITIGEDCLMSWNVLVIDTDFHSIYYNGVKKDKCKEIVLGKNIWISSDVHILKGVEIKDNTVIASSSLVLGY